MSERGVSLNLKHMSDDFMERHVPALLQEYSLKFRNVTVLCDKHTAKYMNDHAGVRVVVK